MQVIVTGGFAYSLKEEQIIVPKTKELECSFSHPNPFENNKEVLRELKQLKEESKTLNLKGKLLDSQYLLVKHSKKIKKLSKENEEVLQLSSLHSFLETLLKGMREERAKKEGEEKQKLFFELDTQYEKEVRRKEALHKELDELDEEILKKEDKVRGQRIVELKSAKNEVEAQEKLVLSLVKNEERLRRETFSRYHFSLLKKKTKLEIKLKVLEKRKQHSKLKEESLQAHLETLLTLRKQGKTTYLSPLKKILSLGLLQYSSVASVRYQLEKTDLMIKEEKERFVSLKNEESKLQIELKEIQEKIKKEEERQLKEEKKKELALHELEKQLEEREEELSKKVKKLSQIAKSIDKVDEEIQELLQRKSQFHALAKEQEKNSSETVKKEYNNYIHFLKHCEEECEDFLTQLKKQKIGNKQDYEVILE